MGETRAVQPSVVFGKRVRRARLALPGKPNQTEFAERCGWDQAKQSRIENGATIPMDDLFVLASALDEDPYYLFTGLQPDGLSTLAAQINRMELDHWAEDAILTVARQEERRVKSQREEQKPDELVKNLLALGVSQSLIDAALQQQAAPPQDSESESEGDSETPDEQGRQARA